MAEILKKFGKYFLLDAIAQGGMAEIYRARMATPDGGARLVAIKRILPSFTQNTEFVSMFKSEIKTTSAFSHPNVVQLYDFGEHQSQLYLAMELVDGKNLRQFMGRSHELKVEFPIPLAVYIAEQSAAGLAYAHAFKDKITGAPLNIVHRDISPQNLLISYDGAVKVIDFGIAKAVTNNEATRAGVIKGKPSYLSPEQIAGDELDGRSDIFALGIVLWEVLAGRKLFAAENDYAIIRMIENCGSNVRPPSVYNPRITKDLDEVVMKCLKQNRDERYANGIEMQKALHKVLVTNWPDFTSADLSDFSKELFKNELVEDRQKFMKLNEKAEQLLLTLKDEDVKAAASGKPVGDGTKSYLEIDFAKQDKTNITLDFKGQKPAAKAYSEATVVGGKAAPFTQGVKQDKTNTNLFSKPPQRPAPVEEKSGGSKFVAAAAIVAALAGGYYFYEQKMTGEKRDPAANGKGVDAVAGTVTIEGNVDVATVMVNGKVRSQSLPVSLAGLPAGQVIKVVVTSNGYQKSEQEITLSPAENRQLRFMLNRDEGGTGDSASVSVNTKQVPLRLKINPPSLGTETAVRINGKPVDPLAAMDLVPVGSNVEVFVSRDGYRSYKKTIFVDESKLTATGDVLEDVNLVAAKFGSLSLTVQPGSVEAYVMVDGSEEKFDTPIINKRLPVGQYQVRLVSPVLGAEKTITVTVNEEQLTAINERISVSDSLQQPSQRMPAQNH